MMDILSQILDNGSELTTNMQMFLLMTALMFLPTMRPLPAVKPSMASRRVILTPAYGGAVNMKWL